MLLLFKYYIYIARDQKHLVSEALMKNIKNISVCNFQSTKSPVELIAFYQNSFVVIIIIIIIVIIIIIIIIIIGDSYRIEISWFICISNQLTLSCIVRDSAEGNYRIYIDTVCNMWRIETSIMLRLFIKTK